MRCEFGRTMALCKTTQAPRKQRRTESSGKLGDDSAPQFTDRTTAANGKGKSSEMCGVACFVVAESVSKYEGGGEFPDVLLGLGSDAVESRYPSRYQGRYSTVHVHPYRSMFQCYRSCSGLPCVQKCPRRASRGAEIG